MVSCQYLAVSLVEKLGTLNRERFFLKHLAANVKDNNYRIVSWIEHELCKTWTIF